VKPTVSGTSRSLLAALRALKGDQRLELNFMPDWIGDQMAGVGPEATRVFGRNAQIAAILGRPGEPVKFDPKGLLRPIPWTRAFHKPIIDLCQSDTTHGCWGLAARPRSRSI
jgi:hypothetical protein